MNPATNPWTRPQSLAEVAEWSGSMAEFHAHVRDFLHEFRFGPRADRLMAKPDPLRDRFDEGAVADAYLAAIAVELSLDLGGPRPRWTLDQSRTLERPWFAARSDELRIILLHESPAGFRERNLFVSENALSVA